jgi:hypothetical protein
MAPTIPADVLATQRPASGGSGEFLAAMRPHQALLGVAFFGDVVGLRLVSGVKIVIVVSVVGASVA